MTDRWIEVADRVLVRRSAELDLCTGLVLGDGGCLVVDTRGDATHGAEFAAAIREITGDPWTVVLTHAHFDHCFGTSALLPCPVWAHAGCATALRDRAVDDRAEWTRRYREMGQFARADALAATEVVIPDHLVRDSALLRVGDRPVELRYLGAGHTDHDLVVWVPDARVAFAGDLVEHDATTGSLSAESFDEQSSLAAWPATLTGLIGLAPAVVVPGHGDPVDAGFVARQRAELLAIAELRQDVRAGRRTLAAALRDCSAPEEVVRAALDVVVH